MQLGVLGRSFASVGPDATRLTAPDGRTSRAVLIEANDRPVPELSSTVALKTGSDMRNTNPVALR
jgi:hypothetical protein